MDPIRNFRDFLLLYNQISDTCFNRCANSFMSRQVEVDEAQCIETCAQKFINTNHRVMEVYLEVQAKLVQKRIDEMNAAAQAQQAQAQTQAHPQPQLEVPLNNQEQPKLEVVK